MVGFGLFEFFLSPLSLAFGLLAFEIWFADPIPISGIHEISGQNS
jgi:hypothetical protein